MRQVQWWGGAGAKERQIGTLGAKLKGALILGLVQVSTPHLHDFNSGSLLKLCSHPACDGTLSLHQNKDLQTQKYFGFFQWVYSAKRGKNPKNPTLI